MKLSIVIPICNEAETIPSLYEKLLKTIQKDFKKFSYEIIFVDDGSTDESFTLLKTLHHKNKSIKVIQFSRNFGHHTAIAAGIDAANADYVVIMNGDLQEQPEDIIHLYTKLKLGYDIIYGIRKENHESFLKKLSSKAFWKFINSFTGMEIPGDQAMLRMFNKKVLFALKDFRESNRFYAGLFSWVGFHHSTCIVNYLPRKKGKSKYSFMKMLLLSIDAALGFSNKPLYLISYLGIIISLSSIIFGLYTIYMRIFFNIGILGWPSLMALISFIGGISIFSIGIIGIYVGRLHQEAMRRPLYIINNKLL